MYMYSVKIHPVYTDILTLFKIVDRIRNSVIVMVVGVLLLGNIIWSYPLSTLLLLASNHRSTTVPQDNNNHSSENGKGMRRGCDRMVVGFTAT